MNQTLERLSQVGIIPVIKIEAVDKAVPLANALRAGGLPCAEITFRTANAERAIKLITDDIPDMLVGAGTVLTIEQADKAIGAGAKFIVSPGLNPQVVRHCINRQIPIIPGCSNPSDIETAMDFGLEVVKFFPAEAAGGVKYIKAISSPYSMMKFIPTGGINEKNLNEYLSLPNVLACGGSWMVDESLIKNNEFDKIKQLTQNAIHAMLGFEPVHIGINTENPEHAIETAKMFCQMFGFEYKEGNSSIFAGKGLEVLKSCGRGRLGHIAIGTNYLTRSVKYMQSLGFKFDMNGVKTDINGNFTGAVFFEQEVGGFAVHLIQKG